MTIDFIFFGIIFILLVFGFLKCSSRMIYFGTLLFSTLVLLGYLIPNFNGKIFSLNIPHLFAVLFLFLFINLRHRFDLFFSLFISTIYYLLLSMNVDLMLTYNVNLFFIVVLAPCLPYLSKPSLGSAKLINNIFFVLIIDFIFEYNEFNYVSFDFHIPFKIIVIYLLSLIIYHLIRKLIFKKGNFVKYEKTDFVFVFNYDCV